jgi:small subunit ribosomal protein S1
MHPSEVLKKSDKVEVVVLNINVEERRISLGLKQVQEDPWQDLSNIYTEGHEASGKIARILDKGLVVDLGENVEGFVPISQVIRETSKPLDQEFKTGDSLVLRVIECDQENRRIVLSVVEFLRQGEEEAPEIKEEIQSDELKIEEDKSLEEVEEMGAKDSIAEPEAEEEISTTSKMDEEGEQPDDSEGEGEAGEPVVTKEAGESAAAPEEEEEETKTSETE